MEAANGKISRASMTMEAFVFLSKVNGAERILLVILSEWHAYRQGTYLCNPQK
jgi:hypothetical protein